MLHLISHKLIANIAIVDVNMYFSRYLTHLFLNYLYMLYTTLKNRTIKLIIIFI